MADFSLSPKLAQFVAIGCSWSYLELGKMYPISIRRKYTFSQTLCIFPNSDFNFFMAREVVRIYEVAKVLDLDCVVCPHGSVVCVEVTDYSLNSK